MNCLKPKYIPKPGLSNKPMAKVPGSQVPYAYDYMVVPCGKCISCVKNRQNNFAFRVSAEAEKKGSMSFLTLTYNDNNLPLVSTLWRSNKISGECERITEPDFVCYSRKEDFFGYRADIVAEKAGRFPRYYDTKVLEDSEFEYFTRITPSVCRKDVQLWIKTCRNLLKKLGLDYDWSYACCSEYGPKSCRPHYHICLFGLPVDIVERFASEWKYGFWYNQFIKKNDFAKVGAYVGKYLSKGEFECDSVKCGAACNTRMMTSVSLGSSIVEKFRNYLCAFDMIGCSYDLDSFWIPSKNRYLSRSELVSLCAEIPKRLAVSITGQRYFAIPRIIRNKVFYVKKVSKEGDKVYDRPSKLWKMVVDAIQSQYVELHKREFEQFLSVFGPGKVREAVASFTAFQENTANLANDIGTKNYKAKLSLSKF